MQEFGRRDPESFLAGLDPAQLEAARIVAGPLVIHAGAGSGKTRVISHRVAYAAAIGAADPRRMLVVTFTEKAATEMAGRIAALGLSDVTAKTFHAAALAQLRYFRPGAPEVLPSKARIVRRLVKGLPGGYRFTPAKDLADEIEWAKSRRLTPTTYGTVVGGDAAASAPGAPGAPLAGREPPIPAELFTRLWADYERAKDREGLLDFDDMLIRMVDLLESDEDAAETVRRRYAWFSVDEYQDTNPLQQRLLELWLGDRDDLCVVGDEDQTIYTFTGATSEYLTGFRDRYPGAREVTLERNYRSTPEILGLANRLLAADGRRKQLVATLPSGPAPRILRCADGAAESTLVATTIATLVAEGTPTREIAVLARTNAQLPPIEAALALRRIPFQVGRPFYKRAEVRDALGLLGRIAPETAGPALVAAFEAALRRDLGLGSDEAGSGAEARERQESLALLVELAKAAVAADPALDVAGLAADFRGRERDEATGSADGVALLTLHRAKGLEWDAVVLPGLEEGTLPIRQAESDAEIAEERRLLYVGLTRARRHLVITWAEERDRGEGRQSRRRPSPFLRALDPAGAAVRSAGGARRVTVLQGAGDARTPRSDADEALLAALKAWRLVRAKSDGVPAYVVAHDAMLEEIAADRPSSLAALRRVKGMGPSKLDRYGEELLEVVSGSA